MNSIYMRRWYEDRRREVLEEISALEGGDNLRTQRHRYLMDRLHEINRHIEYYDSHESSCSER